MEINTDHNYKLLVVGGTGFIGQHIVKKSLELGFNTTSLSKNHPIEDERIKNVSYLTAVISDKQS